MIHRLFDYGSRLKKHRLRRSKKKKKSKFINIRILIITIYYDFGRQLRLCMCVCVCRFLCVFTFLRVSIEKLDQTSRVISQVVLFKRSFFTEFRSNFRGKCEKKLRKIVQNFKTLSLVTDYEIRPFNKLGSLKIVLRTRALKFIINDSELNALKKSQIYV